MARDYTQAAEWYRKAAQQGHLAAQVNLGTLYLKGLGVHLDYAQAYLWFSLAARAGSRPAQIGLSDLGKRLTPAQLRQARYSVSSARVARDVDGRRYPNALDDDAQLDDFRQ